jgi:mannose-6-phosphate isomerase-like protein (cupin superfamily)
MHTLTSLYEGESGHTGATFRSGSQPPGYTSKAGTAGHYIVSPDDTGGLFSLYRWDLSGATASGPGPHFHRTYAETFYVTQGSVRLYDGVTWRDTQPGDMLHVPAGGIHAFTNTSGKPASMLMLMTPGVDRAAYFDELARVAGMDRDATSEEWADLMRRHDNVILADG